MSLHLFQVVQTNKITTRFVVARCLDDAYDFAEVYFASDVSVTYVPEHYLIAWKDSQDTAKHLVYRWRKVFPNYNFGFLEWMLACGV